ncbi:hypothetical protein DUZ99_14820 [Xylanibacillus composti]|uniref:Lipoprotein n=1 Tax=Xylanibacillus composti TaxID=1572762 RepID=A0A8J4H3Y8_9BACL|nr:hypothetical protein [Xylanibacillus composti]MDT9726252.1 hypothetical protein [Xylanibacillus composti]GIQ68103.1 hypothetical protein XYCOK13_09270 [Xylanibacillus composti]
MWKKVSGLLVVSLMATGLAACAGAGADDNNRVQRNDVNNVRPLDMDNDIRRNTRDMDMYMNGRNGTGAGTGTGTGTGAGTGMNGRNGTMTDMNGRGMNRGFNDNTMNMDNRAGRGMLDVDMNPLDPDNDDILPDRDDRMGMNRRGGMLD